MSSQRQIEANRKNAQKSTGPKTPEGRAAVRLNGLKHGFTAEALVVPGEEQADFEALLHSFEADYNPADTTEQALVLKLAMADWRLRRLYQMEAAFYNLTLQDIEQEATRDYKDLDDFGRLALVARRDAGTASSLANFSIYESRLERSFYRALRELQRLHAQRAANLKNQSQSVPATQVAPPAPAPLDSPAAATGTADPRVRSRAFQPAAPGLISPPAREEPPKTSLRTYDTLGSSRE